MAKSIDEIMTSRSIVGRDDFPDFDVLDAMIASALKKLLDTHVHFRIRVSVEEQRGQQYDRFLRGRQTAHKIYEHFRAAGACEPAQGLSDLFAIKFTGEGQKPSKGSGNKEESSSDESEIPCRFKFCKNPSCKCWHSFVRRNYKSDKGCVNGNKCHFRHVEAQGKPNKRSKKGGAKGSVALWKESMVLYISYSS